MEGNREKRREIMEKLSQARKLEKEAFLLLLPDGMQGHLDVIQRELKEMAMELLLDACRKPDKERKEAAGAPIRKVDITD